MDIFNILAMLGGLAMFMYGMNVMGDGLAKVSGGKLERILEKLTNSPIKAVLLGAGVTAVIQSSSATTVMVVGFVNSGIMKLSQVVGIIMGANIGTTITSWLLSMTGIEGDSIILQLMKPTNFSPILAIIGIAFIMFSKKESKKDIGGILLGFTVLIFGMEMMSGAVKPLADVPEFTGMLTMFSNPVLGMIAGAVLTAVIQSSSASVGILQALCSTGAVSFGTALPIIMGQNIGTCITAILSSVGAKKNAKRAALIHLYFNLIGTVVLMVVFYLLNGLLHFSFLSDAATLSGIAIVHTVFNVVATLMLLPFGKGLEKLAMLTIRDKEGDEPEKIEGMDKSLFRVLDSRFLDKPAFAVEQCRNLTEKMAEVSRKAVFSAVNLFYGYEEENAERVLSMEMMVDQYEDELSNYMIKLSQKSLSYEDSHTVSLLLHSIGDFERISDHAVNIMEAAKEMNEKGLQFSEEAAAELGIFTKAMKDIINLSFDAFRIYDLDMAREVEPLEEVIDNLNAELKKRHIKRLLEGECTIEVGFVFSDIITNYERIADHCSNLAVSMFQVKEENFEPHTYIDNLKNDNNEFKKMYKEDRKRYLLPKAEAK